MTNDMYIHGHGGCVTNVHGHCGGHLVIGFAVEHSSS